MQKTCGERKSARKGIKVALSQKDYVKTDETTMASGTC